MNKEELLQKIKDEVAEKHSYPSWSAVIKYPMDAETRSQIFDEVANRYAISMCEEQRRACAENATLLIERANKSKVFSTGQLAYFAEEDDHIEVDKQSILNTKNVAEQF